MFSRVLLFIAKTRHEFDIKYIQISTIVVNIVANICRIFTNPSNTYIDDEEIIYIQCTNYVDDDDDDDDHK